MKDTILGILALIGAAALLKFVLNPTTHNLVPAINDDGTISHLIYRKDRWWGLDRENFTARTTSNIPVYTDDSRENAVPPEAYETAE